MTDKLTFSQYKKMVEEQAQAMLDVLASVTTGDFDVHMEIPEGIEVLSDLAVGFSFLVEDVRELLQGQKRTQMELEERVAERTKELETALAEVQSIQRRYIRQEWEAYVNALPQPEETAVPDLWLPSINEAVETQKPVSHTNGGRTLTLPINYAGEVIGVLGFESETKNEWEAEEITAVEAVVEQLGLALENLRLSEQTQTALSETERQARNLQVINEVAQAVSQQIEPVTLLGTVYEQILQIMPADAFMVALYDRAQNLMEFPVIYDAGQVYQNPPTTPSPTSHFYQVTQSGQPILINRSREEVEKRTKKLDKRTMIGNEDRVSASLLYVPLQIGHETIGALSVQSYTFDAYQETDTTMLSGIANHVAVALENARLFEQTQSALTETETLYNVSAKLNAATTLEEVIQAATTPAIEIGATGAALFIFELASDGKPEWMTAAASLGDDALPVGTKFYLPDFPMAQIWLSDPSNALLLGDIAQDKRVDEATKAVLATSRTKASVVMPLVLGNRWIGLIPIQWDSPHPFTPSDQRLYTAIAVQAAVVVDNLLLFAQAQKRATQLQKLSQVEVALSQADTEERILQALVNVLDANTISSVALLYFNTDADDHLLSVDVTGAWANGGFIGDILAGYRNMPLSTIPVASLWLERPHEILFVANAETDSRLNDAMRQQILEQNRKAVAYIPLRTSGRWQGLVSINWSEPHELNDDERFIFQGVLEPMSAVVGTRRAQLAQQKSLAETEALYKATAELNVAQNYHDIITVLRSHTVLGKEASIISLNYFDRPWTTNHPPEHIEAIDFWSKSPPAKSFSPYYQLADFPSTITFLKPDTFTYIEDVATDPRLDTNTRKLYQKRFLANSAIFVPLVVGGQWVGYIGGIYPQHQVFPEAELRRLMVLAGQAAVAVQGLRLLDETRRLFSQEQKRAGELSILNEMARELTLALDLNEVLEKLYLYTAQLMDAQNFYVALYEQPKNEISFPIALEGGKKQQWRSRAFGNGMTEYVIRNGHGLLIEKGVDNWLQSQGIDSIGHPSQSWLGMPLQFGNEVLGVIALQSTQPNVYSHDHFNLLQAVARQGAIAIQSAHLFMAEQNRTQELTVLNQMARDLTLALDEKAVVDKLHEYTSQLMDTTNFYIGIYHSLSDEISFPVFVSDGIKGVRGARKPKGISKAILDIGEPVLVEDGVDQWLIGLGKSPINCDSNSMLGIPMKSGNQVLGVINLQSPQLSAFSKNHLSLLTAIASQGTIALQNARLFQQTQQRARHEQMLREIATKVRNSADVETVMKTAVQEIGRALGRRTYVYLDTQPDLPQTGLLEKEPQHEG